MSEKIDLAELRARAEAEDLSANHAPDVIALIDAVEAAHAINREWPWNDDLLWSDVRTADMYVAFCEAFARFDFESPR